MHHTRDTQAPRETVDQFVARLRQKAASCGFVYVEEAIRDQVIEKGSSTHLRKSTLHIYFWNHCGMLHDYQSLVCNDGLHLGSVRQWSGAIQQTFFIYSSKKVYEMNPSMLTRL